MANLKITLIVLVFFLANPLVLSQAKIGVDVFETGKFSVANYQVEESDPASPPKSLLIVTPNVNGKYPVILFLPGTCLLNSYYTQLFQHVASHGYIVVAPQIYYCMNGLFELLPMSGPEELEWAAKLANWLPSGLQSVLTTKKVRPDLDKLAVGGHSRGGKMAFALALGYAKTPLKVHISALAGVDPVEGLSKHDPVEPAVLDYVPRSLNLSIPVTVLGTELGNQPIFWPCPACAPNGLNHAEFFVESKAPVSHFVTTNYGHMDILDDHITNVVGIMLIRMCKRGRLPKDPMRRTFGGIMVAFLKAYLDSETLDYMTIIEQPYVAPVKLHPVQFVAKDTVDVPEIAQSSI